jgi:hypothetical protein
VPTKAHKPAALTDETWGERAHRAYRTQRRTYGQTYRQIADRISLVLPVADSQLYRLEDNTDLPKTSRVRLLAFLAIIAYGFNPEDFGLNSTNTPLAGLDLKRIEKLLRPWNTPSDLPDRSSGWSNVTAA